jgi:hypothetical protein
MFTLPIADFQLPIQNRSSVSLLEYFSVALNDQSAIGNQTIGNAS